MYKDILLNNIMSVKKYTCNICNKDYKSYKSLWNHKNKFHKSVPEEEQIISNNINKELVNLKNKESITDITNLKQSFEEVKQLMLAMINIFNYTDVIDSYIYLIQEREFIKTKEPIYKIGKSRQEPMKRINQYPKGSICLLHIICKDCDKIETELINIFKKKYEQMKEVGNEYFKGNFYDMIDDIYTYIKDEGLKNVLSDLNSYDNKLDLYDT
jgi:hypothetical protein